MARTRWAKLTYVMLPSKQYMSPSSASTWTVAPSLLCPRPLFSSASPAHLSVSLFLTFSLSPALSPEQCLSERRMQHGSRQSEASPSHILHNMHHHILHNMRRNIHRMSCLCCAGYDACCVGYDACCVRGGACRHSTTFNERTKANAEADGAWAKRWTEAMDLGLCAWAGSAQEGGCRPARSVWCCCAVL